MYKFLSTVSLILGATLGPDPRTLAKVGVPEKEARHLTPDLIVEISDQLIHDNIAIVDIDPDAFDVPANKPKTYKKNLLDEIEFVSER